jgi:hypothetical protein
MATSSVDIDPVGEAGSSTITSEDFSHMILVSDTTENR